MKGLFARLRYALHQVPTLFRRKPKVRQRLTATVTVGPESAKRLGVPVGTVVPATMLMDEPNDSGVLSETLGPRIGVKAR